MSEDALTYAMRPVGFVCSPYRETSEIPKGPVAEHRAEGTLEIRPELEDGLQDIEGFSHLFVVWVFSACYFHNAFLRCNKLSRSAFSPS